MFALLLGVSGRSAGAAKLARASAAKSSGRAELATGAWAMSDAYINRTATKSCGEPVQAWCVYRLDTGLVKEMARFFGGSASVTELGAGVGRYARALTPSVRRYSAYDGMPGIEHRSHGWVTHGDVSNASLELAASDYVVTFEMAEHVPRKFESTLLDLIDRAATRGVILSWSDKGQRRRRAREREARVPGAAALLCTRLPSAQRSDEGAPQRELLLVFQEEHPRLRAGAADRLGGRADRKRNGTARHGHAALRPEPMLPERGRGAVHTRAQAQYDVHDGVA